MHCSDTNQRKSGVVYCAPKRKRSHLVNSIILLALCSLFLNACAADDDTSASASQAITKAGYQPLYGPIKPLSKGDDIYVYTKGSRSEDNLFIALQTLQGIVARTDRPRLWIDVGDNTFVDELKNHYGIRFDETYRRDGLTILEKLKPYTSGRYVLYDLRDRPSISAATTMAGLIDAVAVDTQLEPDVKSKGYTQALDVRGKDCKWVYENYKDQLNKNAIIVHTNNQRQHRSAYYLRDWGPAIQALDWWYDDEDYSRKVYRSITPCSPVYGWQDPITPDEGLSVQIHSEEDLYQLPSDWMLNLSVHAGMGPALKDKTFKQVHAPRKQPQKESGVHYVTFIMSDMDNILTEIGTNSFYSTQKFYANKHRGQFPMTWGMSPSLAELAPHAVDMWYQGATENDIFVAYCGLGYFYPYHTPDMAAHIKRLDALMARCDLSTILLIDKVIPEDKLTYENYYKTAKWFTDMERVKGLYYLEYVEYAPHGGKIFWFDGKPMVTARFDFRTEEFYSAVRSTPEALAKSINSLPKDPASEDGYTMVTVHAWSKGMDGIAETIKLLDENVRVVNGEDFIDLLRMNVKSAK